MMDQDTSHWRPDTSLEMRSNTGIVVFGVGHSGTSIVAKMIGALGWDLMDADEQFCESVAFREMNRKLISSVATPETLENDMRRYVSALPNSFVLKDPRLSLVLDRWIPAFELRATTPLLVRVTRAFDALRASYEVRGERIGDEVGTHGKTLTQLLDSAERQFEAWPWAKCSVRYEDVVGAAQLFRPQGERSKRGGLWNSGELLEKPVPAPSRPSGVGAGHAGSEDETVRSPAGTKRPGGLMPVAKRIRRAREAWHHLRDDRPPPGRLRIACVYHDRSMDPPAQDMAHIMFFEESKALSLQGHLVDRIVGKRVRIKQVGPNLREVPFLRAVWSDYDVIHTNLHWGFETLERHGGSRHPFIVSKLGSVVGRAEVPGVYFYGHERSRLFRTQSSIAENSRAVCILTHESIALWRSEHGERPSILFLPTGVPDEIPQPGPNPYRLAGIHRPVALYAGHIYHAKSQRSVNLAWQDKLNRVGRALDRKGIQLVVIGPGDTMHLDPKVARHLGVVRHEDIWTWQHHAGVGLAIAQGLVQHNESSKIYYYGRSGLPVVTERPVPNASLVTDSGVGTIVEFDDVDAMADAAVDLIGRPRPIAAVDFFRTKHGWNARAAQYDKELFKPLRGADPWNELRTRGNRGDWSTIPTPSTDG